MNINSVVNRNLLVKSNVYGVDQMTQRNDLINRMLIRIVDSLRKYLTTETDSGRKRRRYLYMCDNTLLRVERQSV